MRTQTGPTPNPNPTREEVLRLIASMNAAQLALWYDIGKRIQATPIAKETDQDRTAPGNADWLDATEEQLAAEDGVWDAITAKHVHKLDKLAERIKSEPPLPMFDENGRWLVDDYTEADLEKAESGAG